MADVKKILKRIKKECSKQSLILNGEEWVRLDTINQIVNDEISGLEIYGDEEDIDDDEPDDFTYEDAIDMMYPNRQSDEELEEELDDRFLKD